jgi:hypothetical protein
MRVNPSILTDYEVLARNKSCQTMAFYLHGRQHGRSNIHSGLNTLYPNLLGISHILCHDRNASCLESHGVSGV